MGKLFEVNLHNISQTNEPVTIGLKTDVESLTDNITQLIGGYNDFVKATSAYLDSQSKSRQLLSEIKGIASLYNQPMEAMGMTMKEDGTLSINPGMLKGAALEAEDIAQTFGYLKKFSNSLIRKSNQVSINPMNYVEKTVVAYKNPGHNFVSPYATSAYSGMMFNGYC